MVSQDEFDAFIRRFSVEEALLFIGQVAHAIFDDSDDFKRSAIGRNVPRGINLWQLAFLAKSLVLVSNDYRAQVMDADGLFRCANLYNDLDDPLLHQEEGTIEEVYEFLLRTAYQQFPHQVHLSNDLGRAVLLYSKLPQSLEKRDLELDDTFKGITGLSLREFMVIGLSLGAASKQGHVSPSLKTDSRNLESFLTPQKVESFLAATMVDYDKFRELQKREPFRPGFDKFQFNVLMRYPFIRTRRNRLIVLPLVTFLWNRVTLGIHYDLLEHFELPGGRNDFAVFFGKKIFERYVGLLLEKLYPAGRLVKERKYGNGLRSCDWIVCDTNRNVLIECKASDLRKRSKTFGDLKELQFDLQNKVIKGIETCVRTEDDIRRRGKGLEDIPVADCHYLIVTFDHSFLANTELYRRIVDKKLAEGFGTVPRYHIAGIRDFEALTALCRQRSLGDTLASKEESPATYNLDFDLYLSQLTAENKELSLRNPLLDAEFEEFFQQFQP